MIEGDVEISKETLKRFFRLYKDNKEVIKLISKMFVHPGFSFQEFINQTNMEIIVKNLIAFYSLFIPLGVVWGVSIVHSYTYERSFYFFELIVPYLLTILMGIFAVPGFMTLTFIFAGVIGGLYFIFGRVLKSKASFYDIFSSMILYASGASVFMLPLIILIYIFKNFNIDFPTLIQILSFTGLFFHIFYLPMALSKGLKISIYKAIFLMLLPLVFLIGLVSIV